MPRPLSPKPKRSAGRGSRGGGRGPRQDKPARKKDRSARLGRLSEQVGYLLRRASNVFSAHWLLQFSAEEAAITPVQCGMMILVDENPGLTQIELARLLKVEGSTLWQLVDRLLELGFIRRQRVVGDRRAYAIHLSTRGRKALQRFERGSKAHQQALLGNLSSKERTALAGMLRRVIEAGDRLNDKAMTPVRSAIRKGAPKPN